MAKLIIILLFSFVHFHLSASFLSTSVVSSDFTKLMLFPIAVAIQKMIYYQIDLCSALSVCVAVAIGFQIINGNFLYRLKIDKRFLVY